MESFTRGDLILYRGDCAEVLSSLPSSSIGATITDPPYPEVDRDYGRMTEASWLEMMQGVVRECKRLAVPDGSAMYLLQPGIRHCGEMRLWLWEFLLWAAREWNLVQDVYWWNTTMPPIACCQRTTGLMRPSVKYCIWLGSPRCYRNQDAVLLPLRKEYLSSPEINRFDEPNHKNPSGVNIKAGQMLRTTIERGGSTPFNLLRMSAMAGGRHGSRAGHGAATPYALCEWWVKYISRPGDIVLDPFAGSGTVGLACAALGRRYIGIEKTAKYFDVACRRIDSACS